MSRIIVPLLAGLMLAPLMTTPPARAASAAAGPAATNEQPPKNKKNKKNKQSKNKQSKNKQSKNKQSKQRRRAKGAQQRQGPAQAQTPKPDKKRRPKSSSALLEQGEALQDQQRYKEAGDAYRQALETLSPEKQRANEGARAAMLAAEAYRLAFELDADLSQLETAIDLLDDWLAQADAALRDATPIANPKNDTANQADHADTTARANTKASQAGNKPGRSGKKTGKKTGKKAGKPGNKAGRPGKKTGNRTPKTNERTSKPAKPAKPKRASLYRDIEQMAAELREPYVHLQRGNAALEAQDLLGASEHYTLALSALATQRRDWASGARLALRVAHTQLTVHDQRATALPDIESNRPRLQTTSKTLAGVDQTLDGVDQTLTKAKRNPDDAEELLPAARKTLDDTEARLTDASTPLQNLTTRLDTTTQTLDRAQTELQTTQDLLTQWYANKPTSDQSLEAEATVESLDELQARIDDLGRRQAAVGAQLDQLHSLDAKRLAALRRVDDLRQRLDAQARANTEAERKRRRRISIALLSTGAVATAAGAGLLGEGLVFTGTADELGNDASAEADSLQQMHGNSYDRSGFDADLDEFRDESRRRNLGFIAGGSALLGVGLATGIVGAVMFARNRPARGTAGERARLLPSVSPTQLTLSLSKRF